MTIIRAKQALLPTGWASDIDVEVGEDGRIAAAGPAREGRQAMADVDVDILLAAPANIHSHAFQRAMAGLTERRGPDPRDSFWTWRKLMYRFLDRLTPDHVEAIAAFVQMEMLEAGYATNVEFHYLHHQPGGVSYDNPAEMAERIAAAAAATGIGLTLLPVHYQYGGCDRRPLGPGQIRFGTDMTGFETLWQASRTAMASLPADCAIGVAPHSLRAVAPDAFADLLALAGDAPFHMHLAEQEAEVAEVLEHWGKRPVEWLLANVAVDDRWCLIHCTQMEPHETEGLAATGAVAGLCPITESSLGDGIYDGKRWLDVGGRIAIGSDSNIRITLSEELRTLDYSQRLRDKSRAALATADKSTGRRLFDAICEGGARAAGRRSGRIEPGAWADLLALSADHPDMAGRAGDTALDTYVFAGDDRMVDHVWAAGRHVVRHGAHTGHDAITARYRAVMAELGATI